MCLHVFCDLFGVVCMTDFVLCVLCVLSCWAISVDLLVVNSMCHAADRTMTSHYPYTLAHVRKYTLTNNKCTYLSYMFSKSHSRSTAQGTVTSADSAGVSSVFLSCIGRPVARIHCANECTRVTSYCVMRMRMRMRVISLREREFQPQ